MKELLIFLAAIIVVSGVVVSRSQTLSVNNQNSIAGVSSTPSPTLIPTAEPSMVPTITIPPTQLPTLTPMSTTQPATTSQGTSLNSQLIYPGASVISSTNQSLALASNDDPQTITNWYKEKLKTLNTNVTSFVQTSSNDNVKNILAAAGNGYDVEIEITKSPQENVVNVKVAYK